MSDDGVSVESRGEIWQIIHNQKQAGRAIIVWTHSMDEADALARHAS